MAIEDFEWEGAAVRADELARPVKTGVWARLKQSVWLEPALKLGGMGALLGVLAGIGVVATTYAKPGLPLPEGPRAVAAALGTSWLKPTPAASEHASAQRRAPELGAVVPSSSSSSSSSAAAAPPSAGSPSDAPVGAPPSAAAPVGTTADGKVILNVASAEELTKLPGVGLKRAQAIVALRAKLKRFKTATELLRVKGIGPRGLQRMLPHLVLDGPPAVTS
ncbi:MAG: helix-hairpin-helix domain-containing protein [Myxococcales bacterium]|nr:MAG: helix-hairpin-helix domain-containing protein [Myxococcales bacterium]